MTESTYLHQLATVAQQAPRAGACRGTGDRIENVEAMKHAGTLCGTRILVVDDEPDALVFISTVLEDHGATVVRATDGTQAIEIARREKPDLITLDLSMPGKSGVAVFSELRREETLMHIPVCIITGRPEMRELIYQRRTTPPEGYIEKPIDEITLVRNVRKILETKRAKLEVR